MTQCKVTHTFLIKGKLELLKAGDEIPPHLDFADDGRPYEVSVLVTFDVDRSAVEQQGGALVHPALDQGVHPGLGLGGDQGPDVGSWLVACGTEVRSQTYTLRSFLCDLF